MITDSDDVFVPRPLYALPVGYKWNSRSGITLIGDAAHVSNEIQVKEIVLEIQLQHYGN
jgi:hypothetical protein